MFNFYFHIMRTQKHIRQQWILIYAPLRHLIDVLFSILYNASMKNKRVPISLTEDQHQALEQAAAAMGLTISSYIRLAALERVKRDA